MEERVIDGMKYKVVGHRKVPQKSKRELADELIETAREYHKGGMLTDEQLAEYEESYSKALEEQKSQEKEWKERNKPAIESMNKFVEGNGLISDRHREFGDKKE